MLEIRLPDDSGLAVRAAAIVARRKAIEPEHALLAASQRAQRGAADAADA